MKNYTVFIDIQADHLGVETVKKAIEDLLLRAHPMIAFRIGAAVQTGSTTVAVEIATDAAKNQLATLLHDLEDKWRVNPPRIHWGSQISENGTHQETGIQNAAYRADPYVKAEPQAETTRRYPVFSIFELLGGILGWGMLIIFPLFYWWAMQVGFFGEEADQAGTVRGIIYLLQILWILSFALIGVPFNPWQNVASITCSPDYMEVKYWLRKTPRRLKWTDITGMDTYSTQLVIFLGKAPVKLVIKPRKKPGEAASLVKTIVHHAQLYFVENQGGKAAYKRSDAP